MKASVILNPNESKALIAKGISQVPEVKEALKNHTVVIALGSTNGYVAEQLTGKEISKENFLAGFNADLNNVTKKEEMGSPIILEEGKITDKSISTVRDELQPDDVFIKGGNALDSTGTVGVMVGAADGGTVGKNMGYVVARGTNLIIPIGLEKLIAGSVPDISKSIGNEEFSKTMGSSVGLWPLNGYVVTELEALDLLFGVQAYQIGAGGLGRGKGSLRLGITGPKEDLNRAFKLIENIKGVPDLVPEGRYPKDDNT